MVSKLDHPRGVKCSTFGASPSRAKGINLYEWSPEELAKYRDAVQKGWTEFATTPEAKALLASHISFLRDLGAMK